MNNKELTSLAIKVFAIYVLIQAIMLIAQSSFALNSFFQGDDKWLFLVPILSIVGLVCVFIILWKLSKSVYSTVTPIKENNEKFKVDQMFILGLIGLYLVVDSLFSLSQGALSLFYIYQSNEYGTNYLLEAHGQTIFHLMAYCIRFIIGITLMIRPHGWAKLMYKVRTFGLSYK